MLKSLVIFSFVFGFCLFSGCAHNHHVQGVEKKSEIPEGIRVSIGSSEISEGEKVDVLKKACKKVQRARGGPVNSCRDEKVGEAKVLKVLDHDAAIVEPDPGFTMDTNMTVEKKVN